MRKPRSRVELLPVSIGRVLRRGEGGRTGEDPAALCAERARGAQAVGDGGATQQVALVEEDAEPVHAEEDVAGGDHRAARRRARRGRE